MGHESLVCYIKPQNFIGVLDPCCGLGFLGVARLKTSFYHSRLSSMDLLLKVMTNVFYCVLLCSELQTDLTFYLMMGLSKSEENGHFELRVPL